MMRPWILPVIVAAVLLWIGVPPKIVHGQNALGQFGPTAQQAVTGTAVRGPNFASTAVCVQAFDSNTSPAVVYIGNSSAVTTSTGYGLAAGKSTCVPAQNSNQVWVVASGAGSSVYFLTTNQ